MASTVPPVKGQAYTFCLGLDSQASAGLFQDNPTIASGDVVVVRDATVLGNITTLPSALVGCTRLVQVTVSADEMDGDQIYVLFHDAAGDEWKDVLAIIDTAAQTLDTISINVDAILADTGTDIPASIAALNDLSATEAQAAAAAAIAAAGITPTDVWTYPDRRTTDATVVSESTIADENITIHRGDTWSWSFNGLGSLASYVSIDFMLKTNKSDADTAALVHIRLNASGVGCGLLLLNGEDAETPTDGSITITDESAGNVAVQIKAAATAELVPGRGHYDVQVITDTSVDTPVEGLCKITEDVNRSVR